MIQTKYFCDLCEREIEVQTSKSMFANVQLQLHNEPSQRDFHICKECVEPLNPYELIAEIVKKIKTPPGFREPEVYAIKISATRYVPSVGEK
jgi:hypothetical protein